jgi:hypothetical protein
MAAHIVLPWIHRAFSLMKRWGAGTYHGLRRKHVDTYLNEFVFRYNRRFYRHVSFETLLGLAADKEPASYWDLIKKYSAQNDLDPYLVAAIINPVRSTTSSARGPTAVSTCTARATGSASTCTTAARTRRTARRGSSSPGWS